MPSPFSWLVAAPAITYRERREAERADEQPLQPDPCGACGTPAGACDDPCCRECTHA